MALVEEPDQRDVVAAFAAAVYWLFCFSMSRYSQNLEKRLYTGHKR